MTQILMIEADDATIAKLRDKIDESQSMRVVGLFQLMRTRCNCVVNDFDNGKHRGRLSFKGPRFKWFIHTGCGKPVKGNHSWVGNLLDRSQIKPRQNDKEPDVVIDSITLHDYGFYKGEGE